MKMKTDIVPTNTSGGVNDKRPGVVPKKASVGDKIMEKTMIKEEVAKNKGKDPFLTDTQRWLQKQGLDPNTTHKV